jgi:hypothetical protein
VFTHNLSSLSHVATVGQVRRFNHFFFTYQQIRSFIPDENNPLIFVTRQEHLLYDWKKINYLFGQKGDVVIPQDVARNVSGIAQPVTRQLSQQGTQRLCKALQKEYESYVRILREAVNLSDEDVQESLEEVKGTCPNVIIPP